MSWTEAMPFKLPRVPRLPGLPRLPRPEGRSEAQIDRDLEDEFAFHIDRSASEMVKDGVDPNEARRQAAARFGDVVSIKRKCRRIALKERIMLQRVNFVMMIVVMLLVIGVGVQVVLMQRHNAMSLEAIKAHLAIVKSEARPAGLPTLGSIFSADDPSTWIDRLKPGTWQQVDQNGEKIRDGVMLEILADSDIHNRTTMPGVRSTAFLHLPDRPGGPPVFLGFQSNFDLLIWNRKDEYNPSAGGRWTFERDRLLIDISPAAPLITTSEGLYAEPLVFEKRDARGSSGGSSTTNDNPRSPGYIYTDGSIARPGVYGYPSVGRLTVARFMAASGGVTDESKKIRVSVTSLDPDRNESRHVMLSDLRNDPSLDFDLNPGDLVLFEEIGDDGKPVKWQETKQQAKES
ncbi:MAG: permease prefix domain 1-containing protein [Phycisphaerales bacterium]|nr:permease prefix domain 1-containing protein [Phycisphaerales bacterium]